MKKYVVGLLWLASLYVAYIVGTFQGLSNSTPTPTQYGRFLTNPQLESLPNGRDMKLTEDFVYVDPDGTPWLSAKDRVVNGASIPRLLWTTMGGPFSGKFRSASIVHDTACEDMTHTHQEVHKMFYYACLAGGVDESKAMLMYWAVSTHGPKWRYETKTKMLTASPENGGSPEEVTTTVVVPVKVEEPTEEDLQWAKQYIEQNDPTLEEMNDLMQTPVPDVFYVEGPRLPGTTL